MDAKKCDRCNQFYVKPIMSTINIIDKTNVNYLYLKKWKENSNYDETIDLCPECKHDLDEWFDKFKRAKSEEKE